MITGFKLLRSELRARPQAGGGHLHFILDDGRFDQPQFSGVNGRLALRLGVNGFYSPAYVPSIEYHRIPTGVHTLIVELVNTDERPTGVKTSVTFRVR
jgi:hypothetical protein